MTSCCLEDTFYNRRIPGHTSKNQEIKPFISILVMQITQGPDSHIWTVVKELSKKNKIK